MEFYKRTGMILAMFNFISVFFMFLTVFAYSLIQYLAKPLLNITYMLFTDTTSQNNLIKILDYFFVLPQFLDISFLVFVIMLMMNLFYLAWKTEKGNIYYTLMFSLIGFPLWIFLMAQLDNLRNWSLAFLGSSLSNTITMPFFNYIQANSLYFSIIVFMIVIGIKTIPFDNIKLFKANGDNKNSNNSGNFKQIIQQ